MELFHQSVTHTCCLLWFFFFFFPLIPPAAAADHHLATSTPPRRQSTLSFSSITSLESFQKNNIKSQHAISMY